MKAPGVGEGSDSTLRCYTDAYALGLDAPMCACLK